MTMSSASRRRVNPLDYNMHNYIRQTQVTWGLSCILMWYMHNLFYIVHYLLTQTPPPPRPRSVSEVSSPSAPPILRIGPGQQWFGVFARDYQRPLHRGLRLPARWADGHHHSLPHLCHRGHCGSHHADLLRGPAGSALRLLFSFWNPLLRGQMFPGNNRSGNNTAFIFFSPILFKVFNQGAVVTDAAQCTSLGFEALAKQGSSVDAAITAALCLGIVHPHTSGIGG